MTVAYLTKVWVGRHWRYVRTRRCHKLRTFWKCGVVSYRRVEADRG